MSAQNPIYGLMNNNANAMNNNTNQFNNQLNPNALNPTTTFNSPLNQNTLNNNRIFFLREHIEQLEIFQLFGRTFEML